MSRTFLLLALAPSLLAQPCATCHPDIAATYARTGMARSFSRPQPARSEPFYHAPSGTWYQLDGLSFRRWRIGPAGEQIHYQQQTVDYLMGSGNHVRTYLHRTARGTLIELPLSWYSQNGEWGGSPDPPGGTWALSPGHDRDYMLRPRAIAYECMFCHNAYPRIPAGHDEPGSEPVYSGDLPEGIGCERCHGPGANHVRAAESGVAPEAVRAAIVNPARLSPERQLEVCMQCHLETTSLQLPHSIQRYGRGPFSYRPGEPLGNFMIFFDHAPGSKYQDDFEIASSAYRLRRSQCFLRSAGKLTCTTCHNPHDIPRGDAAAARYNSVCANCHAALPAAHTHDRGCIGCHMSRRRTQDVVHAVMTDHLIQRRPPPGDLLAPIAERQEFDANQYRGEVVPYYPAPLPQTGENALYVAVAQVTQKSNLAKGLPRLAAEIAKQKPARPGFYIELGQGWLAAGKPTNAIAPLEEALRRKPDSSVAALSLADALTQAGQAPRAVAVLNRALKTALDDPLLWYQLGITKQDDPAPFEKAVALDGEFAEARNLLGAAYAAAGDLDRAGRQFVRALEINPDLAEALGNYGHLLAARGDYTEAAFYLARSIKLKPGDGEVRTNYAVALAGLGRFDEAEEQTDAALKADPKSAEAHNFHGTLLERRGQTAAALREYQEAMRLQPDFEAARRNAARLAR